MVFILWDNRQGKSRGNQAWQGPEVARNSCAAEVARACWRKVSHEAGTETRPICVSIKRVQVLKLVPGALRVTQSRKPCHLGLRYEDELRGTKIQGECKSWSVLFIRWDKHRFPRPCVVAIVKNPGGMQILVSEVYPLGQSL